MHLSLERAEELAYEILACIAQARAPLRATPVDDGRDGVPCTG
jgi:hypothetical protein